MSMLDRPISEFDGPIDSVRVPVVPPTGECKPFQDVLIELAARLQVPGVRRRRRHAQVPRLPRLHHQLRDRAGLGHRLSRPAGAARTATSSCAASRIRSSGRCTRRTIASTTTRCRRRTSTCATGTAATWSGRSALRIRRYSDPIVDPDLFGGAAEVPPRGAGQGHGRQAARRTCASASTRTSIRCRSSTRRSRRRRPIATQLSARRRHAAADGDVPLVGFAERVAAPDPRAQLSVRQSAHGARAAGIADGGWMWVESQWGKVRCMARYSRGRRARHRVDVERDRQGAGRVASRARRERIAARLPAESPDHRRAAWRRAARRISNSDPITGQAGWYDVRVRIYPAGGGRAGADVAAVRRRCPRRPGRRPTTPRWHAYFAGRRWRTSRMTQLALVIDLNVCVGCHACVTSCKEWNTSGSAGPLADLEPVRQGSDRHLLQSRADLRGRRVPEHADRALPEVVPALRGSAVRAGVPDRRELQARRGRHRARRLRQVHRLQVLRVGVPVRRARARRRAQGDDEVHAVRRPHLRQGAARGRAQARVRARRARPTRASSATSTIPSRSSRRAIRESARLRADAGVGHAARQPLPAAAQDADAASTPTSSRAPTIRSRSTACCRSRRRRDPSLDDVMSW